MSWQITAIDAVTVTDAFRIHCPGDLTLFSLNLLPKHFISKQEEEIDHHVWILPVRGSSWIKSWHDTTKLTKLLSTIFLVCHRCLQVRGDLLIGEMESDWLQILDFLGLSAQERMSISCSHHDSTATFQHHFVWFGVIESHLLHKNYQKRRTSFLNWRSSWRLLMHLHRNCSFCHPVKRKYKGFIFDSGQKIDRKIRLRFHTAVYHELFTVSHPKREPWKKALTFIRRRRCRDTDPTQGWKNGYQEFPDTNLLLQSQAR
jgi:hypothetical protein